MTIHKEGYGTLRIVFIALLITHFVAIKYLAIGYQGYTLLALISILLYAFLLYFFRNPDRAIHPQPGGVLSPADGTIVAIQEVQEEEYFKEKRMQVSIYMSPLNVHINRHPIAGIVKFFKYHPGKYLVAFHPKASTKNERTTVVVENEQGVQVLFRQIAGFVARRIVSYVREGDQVQQGHECGFIKFGSRADVFLPLGAKLKVGLQEKVKGGVSIIAEL
ncbi:MAG: phosphatidylserine decarboxylase family protein [Roseivirga sp.]